MKSTPWTDIDRKNWFNSQEIKRSYDNDVLSKIDVLKENVNLQVISYGALEISVKKYQLQMIKSRYWSAQKKNILITGGVHGYETSGVHGALEFAINSLDSFGEQFNFIIAPCISPWAYETINRWNNLAIDPNRSFFKNGPSLECNLLLKEIESLNIEFLAHFDLHETTDTDNSVFRPALESRDAIKQELWEIPDGFYLVGDTHNDCFDFQKAIIDSVRKVTHIAPHDAENKIIGEDITQEGVINYDVKSLFLCTGFSNAKYSTTTEVYPDSPKVTDAECIEAQVAAIVGGLNYLKDHLSIS